MLTLLPPLYRGNAVLITLLRVGSEGGPARTGLQSFSLQTLDAVLDLKAAMSAGYQWLPHTQVWAKAPEVTAVAPRKARKRSSSTSPATATAPITPERPELVEPARPANLQPAALPRDSEHPGEPESAQSCPICKQTVTLQTYAKSSGKTRRFQHPPHTRKMSFMYLPRLHLSGPLTKKLHGQYLLMQWFLDKASSEVTCAVTAQLAGFLASGCLHACRSF